MILINKNFTRLWVGQAISLLGDFAFDITLLLWIATILLRGEQYGPVISSGVLMIVALVTVTIGPIAGVYVDRWDKRRTMLVADLARAILVSFLTVIALLPHRLVPVPVVIVLIWITVALCTALSQFFGPARFVMIGDVVPPEQQGRAASYTQTAFALAAIVSPPIAAPLVLSVGVQWALAFNALTFLVSFSVIRGIRVEPRPSTEFRNDFGHRPSAGREFRAGLRSIRQNSTLLALLTACVLATLGTGAVNALEVYFVQENLHANAGWLGVLAAVFGVGSLIGALGGGILGDRAGHRAVFKGSIFLFGVGLVVYSRLDNVIAAAIVSAALGLALGALNTVAFPLILSLVPRDYLGRTMAVFNPVNQSASILSIIVAGIAVSTVLDGLDADLIGMHFGRIDTVFTVSGALALAGAAYALAYLGNGKEAPICEAGSDAHNRDAHNNDSRISDGRAMANSDACNL